MNIVKSKIFIFIFFDFIDGVDSEMALKFIGNQYMTNKSPRKEEDCCAE